MPTRIFKKNRGHKVSSLVARPFFFSPQNTNFHQRCKFKYFHMFFMSIIYPYTWKLNHKVHKFVSALSFLTYLYEAITNNLKFKFQHSLCHTWAIKIPNLNT